MPINRRSFLETSLAASALGAAPLSILKAGPSPNGKLNIACIGVGGRGSGNARLLARDDNVNVIALCDVDEHRHRKCIADKKNLHGIKLWKDYRVMFDKIGKEIDAIHTATPDHVRFAVSMFAIRRGKHVYAEKPLCHTVHEARVLTEEARKHKVVTQMGNQGHSTEGTAMVRDWVQGGCIGDVREVIAYSRKNYWTKVEPVKGCTVPKTLQWDLFLNRAEEIPFSTSYISREWIRYSHFSGSVGDMGSHLLDPAYYALDLRVPTSVMAEVPEPPPTGWLPKAAVITWEFAARGDMPPVTVKYYLGPDVPYPRPEHLEEGREAWFINSGSVLVGEHASIMAGESFNPTRIFPEAAMKATEKPPEVAYRRKAGNHLHHRAGPAHAGDHDRHHACRPERILGPCDRRIVRLAVVFFERPFQKRRTVPGVELHSALAQSHRGDQAREFRRGRNLRTAHDGHADGLIHVRPGPPKASSGGPFIFWVALI